MLVENDVDGVRAGEHGGVEGADIRC
jgi:hypothetical protein